MGDTVGLWESVLKLCIYGQVLRPVTRFDKQVEMLISYMSTVILDDSQTQRSKELTNLCKHDSQTLVHI